MSLARLGWQCLAGIFLLCWEENRSQSGGDAGVIFPRLCKSWERDRTSQQDGSSSRALAGGSPRKMNGFVKFEQRFSDFLGSQVP